MVGLWLPRRWRGRGHKRDARMKWWEVAFLIGECNELHYLMIGRYWNPHVRNSYQPTSRRWDRMIVFLWVHMGNSLLLRRGPPLLAISGIQYPNIRGTVYVHILDVSPIFIVYFPYLSYISPIFVFHILDVYPLEALKQRPQNMWFKQQQLQKGSVPSVTHPCGLNQFFWAFPGLSPIYVYSWFMWFHDHTPKK